MVSIVQKFLLLTFFQQPSIANKTDTQKNHRNLNEKDQKNKSFNQKCMNNNSLLFFFHCRSSGVATTTLQESIQARRQQNRGFCRLQKLFDMLHERHETIFDQKLRQRRRREIKGKRNKQKHNQGAFTIKLTLKIFFGVVFLHKYTTKTILFGIFGCFSKSVVKTYSKLSPKNN